MTERHVPPLLADLEFEGRSLSDFDGLHVIYSDGREYVLRHRRAASTAGLAFWLVLEPVVVGERRPALT